MKEFLLMTCGFLILAMSDSHAAAIVEVISN